MKDGSANEQFLVLVVEDEPAALRLIEEALEETEQPVDYIGATDGVEAFDVLYGRGEYAGTRRPDLILLDLNLPGRTGRMLLSELKEHDDLRPIPVVVFSQTDDEEVIADCYRLGANAYIVKPMDYDGMRGVVETLADFWVNAAERVPR